MQPNVQHEVHFRLWGKVWFAYRAIQFTQLGGGARRQPTAGATADVRRRARRGSVIAADASSDRVAVIARLIGGGRVRGGSVGRRGGDGEQVKQQLRREALGVQRGGRDRRGRCRREQTGA